MIYKLLRYTMTLLLAPMVSGLLVSCINDEFVDVCPSEAEGKMVYLSINVKSDSGINLTRADKEPSERFEDGDWTEHYTTDHIAIFFNENQTKDGPGSLYAITTLGLPATHEDFPNDDPNEREANYIAVFRVTEEDKDKIENILPKYCLVVLNSGNMKKQLEKYKDKKDVDYNTIVKEIWPSYDNPEKIGFTEDGRFTMTNSVYVEKDENGKEKVHVAQKILPPNFQKTPDLAKRNAVKIYVERMVAKFTFEIHNSSMTRSATDGSNGIIMDPKNSNGDDAAPLVFFDQFEENEKLYKKWPWKVNIKGWGINAQEQDSYLFKNINIDPTKEEYFDKWNDSDNHRSYWCEDSHYNYGKDDDETKAWTYPLQYRKAIDYKTSKELEYYGEDGYKNVLKNYTYNEFVDNTKEEVYAPENTYDPSLYNDKNNPTTYLDDRTSLLAGTHLLVCAEVLINKGDDKYVPLEHIYRDRQGIYYESKRQFFKMFVHSINSLFESQRTMDFTLYDWDKGGLIWKSVKIKNSEGEEDEKEVYEFTAKPVNTDKVVYKLYYHDPKNNRIYEELTDKYIDDLTDEEFDEMIDMVPATIEYGDGRVLPWLKNNKLVICANDAEHSGLRIFARDEIIDIDGVPGKDGTPQIGYDIIYGEEVTDDLSTEDYNNCIRSLLCEWFGPIDHFNGGKMYYAHPISHKKSEAKTIAETEEALGAYGVVRNCWYQFTLTGINMIGTPVDNPDDSIVPQEINIKDVINTKVEFEFIPWHEEETVAPLY